MPIYEYRCEACGNEVEALQKVSESPLTTCPRCAKESLVKLISAAGFQLKGSGWYATDFKGSGGSKKPEEAKPEAKAETKAESPAPAAGGGCSGGGCSCD